MITFAGAAALSALLAVAALCDLKSRTIPNLLPALTALAGLVLATPGSSHEWLDRALSASLICGGALAIYLCGGVGGGDLKLLGAVALWIPTGGILAFLTALSVWTVLQSGFSLAVMGNRSEWRKHQLPYAISIAAAGVTWVLWALSRAPGALST